VMWIVSLVFIGLKYYGAIDLGWAVVLVFAMAPVWLPLVFAYAGFVAGQEAIELGFGFGSRR